GGFAPERVLLLTDQTATRDALTRALAEWLPGAARGADLAVLYFAGHGTVAEDGGREEGYLLPVDADPADRDRPGVPMREVARCGDGGVGVTEHFEYVARGVGRDARERFGKPQTPWRRCTDTGQVYLSQSRRPHASSAGRPRKDDGPAAALRELERLLPGAGE